MTNETSDYIDTAFDEAGFANPNVREYVRHWAGITGAARVEVVSAADDAAPGRRSPRRASCSPRAKGRYYSRSYDKDTARSEERTIVATNNPADKGIVQQLASVRRDEAAARGAHARRLGGQDDVRHPVPDGPARITARALSRPASNSPTAAPSCCT